MENNQGDDASRSERGKRDFGAARGPRGDRGDRGDRGGFRGRDDRGGYGGPRGERGGFRGPRDDRGGFGGPRGERGGFRGPRDDRGERGGFRGPRDDRGERGGFGGPRDDRGERGGFGGPRGERGGFGGPRGERGGFRGPRDDRGERGGFGGPRGERGERGGFRGPRDDRGERGGFGGPRGERGGFRGPRDDRGERGGYGGPRGERGGFRGPRDDRGGFGGPRGERGGFRGPRDDRGERGGYGGPRGERGGFRGPRDDRGERGGYGGPRGERGGFRGPRDDRGERGGYGGPRGERGGFRGPRDERSDRGGERGERDRFRGPREEQAELAARPEETVAIPEDTTLDTTLDNNSPAIAESYEYEYGRSAASSQAAAQMSPDVDLTQQSLALDLDAKLPVVHINNPTWHPIIYRKRVDRVVGNPRPGQLVAVYHSETEQLGYGLFNPNAEILVRMLRLGIEAPDEAYWKQRLDEAIALRRDVLQLDRVTDSYRVVHAEADGLSGLVVDKLGDTLSAEVFSVGMWQRARAVMEYLVERFQAQHWLIRTGPYVLEQEGFAADPLASEQLPAQVTIQEFGTRFRVRFEGGHKTGFFCDQRDNRRQLASYCAGRSVLDLCCYSGGFSVQAKKLGEAAEVTGVDIDEQPLKLARENANLNQVRVNFVKEDAFAYMRDMLRNGRQYDVVVLDPPKLITSRRDLEEGTRKHFDMNRLAMQLVKPGGMLLTCSCAGLLSEEEFQKLLYSASRQAGPELPTVGPDGKRRHAPRAMQILGRSGAAPDHPVSANCREGEYLKAYWLRMM